MIVWLTVTIVMEKNKLLEFMYMINTELVAWAKTTCTTLKQAVLKRQQGPLQTMNAEVKLA